MVKKRQKMLPTQSYQVAWRFICKYTVHCSGVEKSQKIYDKVSADVMISVQKMGESESGHMVF